jgi:hypothetical protein
MKLNDATARLLYDRLAGGQACPGPVAGAQQKQADVLFKYLYKVRMCAAATAGGDWLSQSSHP